MLKIGIIGYGYWGPNLVRNFVSLEACRVKTVVDLRSERLKILHKLYPMIKTSRHPSEVIGDPEIEAVVIATPVATHFELSRKALAAGKHVLVEKPLAVSIGEAEKLIALGQKMKKILMVDHTYLYAGAITKIKELVKKKVIGKIRYYDSTRINLGLFQPDVNVLWDLAPHDLAILYYLFQRKPMTVQAVGMSHLKNGIEDVAYLTLRYHAGFIAHFNCSWSSPIKVRLLMIGGDKKMVVWNDMEPTEKVKIYDSGYVVRTDEEKQKMLVDYRTGDIFIPKIELVETLSLMARDFIAATANKTKPISNAELGLEVVKILELSQRSIKNKGREIEYK